MEWGGPDPKYWILLGIFVAPPANHPIMRPIMRHACDVSLQAHIAHP